MYNGTIKDAAGDSMGSGIIGDIQGDSMYNGVLTDAEGDTMGSGQFLDAALDSLGNVTLKVTNVVAHYFFGSGSGITNTPTATNAIYAVTATGVPSVLGALTTIAPLLVVSGSGGTVYAGLTAGGVSNNADLYVPGLLRAAIVSGVLSNATGNLSGSATTASTATNLAAPNLYPFGTNDPTTTRQFEFTTNAGTVTIWGVTNNWLVGSGGGGGAGYGWVATNGGFGANIYYTTNSTSAQVAQTNNGNVLVNSNVGIGGDLTIAGNGGTGANGPIYVNTSTTFNNAEIASLFSSSVLGTMSLGMGTGLHSTYNEGQLVWGQSGASSAQNSIGLGIYNGTLENTKGLIWVNGAGVVTSAGVVNVWTNIYAGAVVVTNGIGTLSPHIPVLVPVGASPFTFSNPTPVNLKLHFVGQAAAYSYTLNGVLVFTGTNCVPDDLAPTNVTVITYSSTVPLLYTNSW